MHSAKKTYDGKIAGLYDLEETLGRGHFAVVKLARHVFTGEKVAVKVIDKTKLDEVSRAHLFQEVRCMKLVQHPNVVRLYEVIDTQTKLYLILELGDGGDLYDYIMKHEAGLGEDMAKEYFRQIVRAISYCHQLHVVHRDLKPENVVFFERLGVVKLTDFGFSNKFCPGQKLDTSCGSLAYSAPEILLGDSYDAPAVDVWSLGVILYMLVAGQAPFQEANDSETLTMIMDCKYTIPTHVSESCKRLIAKMLVREPESRATLEDIASDPWLGGPPQVEYLPLVSRHQVTEEDHNIIINKMVNGNIATKEEVLEALDRNEYNHITATYFLLAERKLRTYRQEQAQSRLKPSQALVSISTPKNSLGKANSEDSALSEDIQIAQGSRLSVPRGPGESVQGKVRKCSIVQEEEDEEEYCSVGSGQELTPPHSSLNRRGSRSEGKLNVAIQERIAEERRKEKKESPSTSPHPSNVGRVGTKDDASWPSKRTSPTSIHSGIPASYIPGSGTWRVGAGKTSSQSSSSDGKGVRSNVNIKRDGKNAMGEPAADSVSRTNECKTSDPKKEDKQTDEVINSSQLKTSPKAVSPKIRLSRENSEFSTVSLKDSATITIPFHSPSSGSSLGPKFKTLPSPTRNPHSVLSSHEIFEGIPELSVSGSGDSCGGEGRTSARLGVSSINYEQRRSKFHKARTASCSSSDASDDDSESRKKRAHKISIEKNNQRRDSHDDSSDGQDRGGSGGAGGNPASGLGSGGDGMQNENQSNGNQGNRSTEGGSSSGDGNNRHQRQCNGENFRRNRRRTGETRLRESQSLNRIMEVQESEGGHYSTSTAEVFSERLGKSAGEPRKALASNSNGNVTNVEKGKSAKSLGARFLQSWSNTISSTKLSVQKRKYEGEGRRAGSETRAADLSEHYSKHYSDEKENKAIIEKTGKKMKVLGRYFQVSKKLCIPLPSLSTKGRLYKARSCGSIGKDRITSPTTPTSCASSTLKPTANGTTRVGTRGRSKSPNILINQSRKESRDSSNSPKKSPLKSPVKFKQGKNKTEDPGGGGGGGGGGGRHIQDEPKGSYNKNLTNGGRGLYDCPDVGLCRTHMRDAAKCHLS